MDFEVEKIKILLHASNPIENILIFKSGGAAQPKYLGNWL
jgi:hypothetical protein